MFENKRMSINLTTGVLWWLCQIFFWLGWIIFLKLIPFPLLFQLGRETKKILYETWRVVKSEVVKGSLCRASRVGLPRFPVDCLIRIIFISSRAFRLVPVVLNWSRVIKEDAQWPRVWEFINGSGWDMDEISFSRRENHQPLASASTRSQDSVKNKTNKAIFQLTPWCLEIKF